MPHGGVNPYSFVPLGGPVRSAPGGHAQLADGALCGQLVVTLRARTSLRIGSGQTSDEGVQLFARDRHGAVVVPGSSFKGAVRFIHEALTDSCLRVVDMNSSPVHRDQPGANTGLSLAVVTQTGKLDGEQIPTAVRLCDRGVQILAASPSGAPVVLKAPQGVHTWRTGDHLDVTGFGKAANHGLFETATAVKPGGQWVLLITDIPATRKKHPIYFVAGHVSPGEDMEVTRSAQISLRRALSGTDDVRPAVRKDGGDFALVSSLHGAPDAWERARSFHQLIPGMPVWVRHSGGVVTDVKLSQIWRGSRSGRMSERVGDAQPCEDPASLCPSCQIFGSAGEQDENVGADKRQSSYGGHVRFEDLAVRGPVTTSTLSVTQLQSPKPTAGQFYLTNAADGDYAERRVEAPPSNWGSRLDDRGARQIRGRKFYWATTSRGPHGARAHRSTAGEAGDCVEVVNEGATFTGRVTFDGLTPQQLGGLIAALDPRRVWPGDDVVGRIGGGKPFGWGAIDVDVELVGAQSGGQRYLGEQASDVSTLASQAVGDFVGSLSDVNGDRLRSLRHVLMLDYVADQEVNYPNSLTDRFGDQDFEFWSRTSGKFATDHSSQLRSLPPASATPGEQRINL